MPPARFIPASRRTHVPDPPDGSRSTAHTNDEFTIEALIRLDSIDKNAELRTLVSRWNGDQKAPGWSIDVTGVKSRYQPRNILMLLVGEDGGGKTSYQIVASNLRLAIGRRQHLVVRVSGPRGEVHFTLRDLDTRDAAAQSVTVPMNRLSRLGEGDSPIVLGGQSRRRTTRQWDGEIEGLRIVPGRLADHALHADPGMWRNGVVAWRAGDAPGPRFTWSGADSDGGENDPRHRAMIDLCQVLLNTNEFFYLH
jgi:hypothetical protein